MVLLYKTNVHTVLPGPPSHEHQTLKSVFTAANCTTASQFPARAREEAWPDLTWPDPAPKSNVYVNDAAVPQATSTLGVLYGYQYQNGRPHPTVCLWPGISDYVVHGVFKKLGTGVLYKQVVHQAWVLWVPWETALPQSLLTEGRKRISSCNFRVSLDLCGSQRRRSTSRRRWDVHQVSRKSVQWQPYFFEGINKNLPRLLRSVPICTPRKTDTHTHTHTLRIRNTYCFSTTTMAMCIA